MSQPVLFYVSGHGFGHARRVAQVIRALGENAPGLPIHVRTAAPASLFEPVDASRISASAIDAGMAEDGPLRIDPAGTFQRLTQLLARREQIVEEEVASIRAIAPRLIVADIPFLAGDVAKAAGVPCLGMSNFTWDWICDPLLGDTPGYADVRRQITSSYARMHAILQLPFGGVSEAFRECIAVPLIAGRSTRDHYAVRSQLGIHSRDDRPIVLVGLRGGVSPEALHTAASSSDCLFLVPQPRSTDLPANVINVMPSRDLDFSDLVAVSDVVLSKLGYGILSDCIAAGTALLWPRRVGFREDAIAEVEVPRYLRMHELPVDDLLSGSWDVALSELLAQATPTEVMPVNGADVCARTILL